MKKLLFVFLLSFWNTLSSQCPVKILNRPDGTIIHYLNPDFVGSAPGCELGCSISYNGKQYLFNTAVRYFGEPKKTKGTLLIHLSDGVTLILSFFSNQITTIKDAKLSFSVFWLNNKDIEQLKKSTIASIVFTEEDNTSRTIIASKNQDFVSRHLNCLNQ